MRVPLLKTLLRNCRNQTEEALRFTRPPIKLLSVILCQRFKAACQVTQNKVKNAGKRFVDRKFNFCDSTIRFVTKSKNAASYQFAEPRGQVKVPPVNLLDDYVWTEQRPYF